MGPCSPFRPLHLLLTVTTLIFWITTLIILYDSDDYVTHAWIYITLPSLSEALQISKCCAEGHRRQELGGRRAAEIMIAFVNQAGSGASGTTLGPVSVSPMMSILYLHAQARIPICCRATFQYMRLRRFTKHVCVVLRTSGHCRCTTPEPCSIYERLISSLLLPPSSLCLSSPRTSSEQSEGTNHWCAVCYALVILR